MNVAGAAGASAGVALAAALAAPTPTAFTARASKVYRVPFESPVTVKPSSFAPPAALAGTVAHASVSNVPSVLRRTSMRTIALPLSAPSPERPTEDHLPVARGRG